jgi:glucan phosphoethanolaminetransferase (alkaline phosphatase superfamily)
MKLKLIGSLFVALIFYLFTILINLFQFNPLQDVFRSGLKIAFTVFAFTLVLSFVLEFFKNDNQEESKNIESNEKQKNNQPKGKVSEQYKNNENNNAKQNKANKPSNNDSSNETNKKREEEFNEMEPPVIEYEEK